MGLGGGGLSEKMGQSREERVGFRATFHRKNWGSEQVRATGVFWVVNSSDSVEAPATSRKN